MMIDFETKNRTKRVLPFAAKDRWAKGKLFKTDGFGKN